MKHVFCENRVLGMILVLVVVLSTQESCSFLLVLSGCCRRPDRGRRRCGVEWCPSFVVVVVTMIVMMVCNIIIDSGIMFRRNHRKRRMKDKRWWLLLWHRRRRRRRDQLCSMSLRMCTTATWKKCHVENINYESNVSRRLTHHNHHHRSCNTHCHSNCFGSKVFFGRRLTQQWCKSDEYACVYAKTIWRRDLVENFRDRSMRWQIDEGLLVKFFIGATVGTDAFVYFTSFHLARIWSALSFTDV